MFKGRQPQLLRVLDSAEAPGEHVAIFGERGVGKTSIASVAGSIGTLRGYLELRVNCRFGDDMGSIWRRIGEQLQRQQRLAAAAEGYVQWPEQLVSGALALLTAPDPSSTDGLTALELLQTHGTVVVTLDEFDRVGDSSARTELVDSMKATADQGLDVTIVIVGVASEVDALIDDHESIARGLNQVEMPRMSRDELGEIVVAGLGAAELVADPDTQRLTTAISVGLPHYTHLLALHAGLVAIESGTTTVDAEHLVVAIPKVAERSEQHVRELWHEATHSTRENTFRELLLAVCMTPTDRRGYFAPGDVRGPMKVVMGEPWSIPRFSGNLGKFTDERGPVLSRSGVKNRPRYRLVEPALVPYAAMVGLRDGLVTTSDLDALLRALPTPGDWRLQ